MSEVTSDRPAAPAGALPGDLIDHLLEGLQIIGFDYRYLYINERAAQQARIATQELLGRRMMDCFPGVEATPMFAALTRCLVERTQTQLEGGFTFPNGTRLVLDLRFVPVPQGACILSLDLTERRNRLAAIVADSDDAILSRTIDGTITSWNRGAERIFGYTAAEIIGQPFDRLLPPERLPLDGVAMARLEHGERVPPFETVRMHKDGRRIEVSVTLSPYRDLAGTVIGVSTIARDITELRRVQRDRVRALDAGEAINRELHAFASSIHHEVGARVRWIDGARDQLIDDCGAQLDAVARRHLDKLARLTRDMASLIDDILKLSPDSARALERAPVDLSALAHAAIERLRLGDPARAIEIAIAPGLTAFGDSRLLAIALDNLLGNAWKFTGRTAAPRIEVTAVHVDGAGAVVVRDNGAGFDMAHVDKLFAPFRRFHDPAEFAGTGIGLAIVQRIIHRHGGRVWARGAPGQGAELFFALPP
jgi:PAS domain S-box-containing protein